MMQEFTAEKFVQRCFDLALIDTQQSRSIWSSVGAKEASLDEVTNIMLQREMLTNYQVDQILRGERTGFFYGKYRTLYKVGQGTFARVYRSRHEETKRTVAVKVLRRRYRDDVPQVEHFLREGEMGLKLRHLNVVPIYEVDSDPRAPYMVMEFVEGQTLRDMMKTRSKLELPLALALLNDICAGLAYAAEKGIAHRDLKMSNVLVSVTGRAKLVDFGLAAVGDTALQSARAIDYAALERGTGVKRDDVRSDIFFAGCIGYAMLTGQNPLTETRDRVVRLSFNRFREIPAITRVEPALPAPVAALITRAIELDPAARFGSPAEMHFEVRQLLERVKAGETLVGPGSVPDLSQGSKNGASEKAAAPAPASLEGAARSVMFVESHVELQNKIREQLRKRGYRVLITADPQRALGRLEDDAKLADAVIFSTAELGESAVEAFNSLGREERTREIPAILLVDQRQRHLIESAEFAPHREMLSLPLKFSALRAQLLKLLRDR